MCGHDALDEVPGGRSMCGGLSRATCVTSGRLDRAASAACPTCVMNPNWFVRDFQPLASLRRCDKESAINLAYSIDQ